MTIYVDVSSAVHAKAGLSRYARCLVQGLRPLLGDRLSLFQNSLGRAGPLAGWPSERVVGVPWGYRSWRAAVLARQVVRWPMDGLLPEGELFHATEHLLPPLAGMPTVMTVHDLIFERLPEHHKFKNRAFLHAAMPLFCRRATALIAISEATKRDLMALYGIDEAKITVIPEAADERFSPQSPEAVAQVRQDYDLPLRYAITVGTIEPRKNLGRLVDACGPLIAEGLLDGLVIVGAKGWLYEGFFANLQTVPWRDRVIFPGYVRDEDLPAMYSGARLAVQPSLYEGFGLPVLEAMACGCPVCCSNVSSLPEVGGEAARLFSPARTDEITTAMREVLADEGLAEAMRARGLARSAIFSWSATARATLAVYERILGQVATEAR